jgi:hypothetical protein
VQGDELTRLTPCLVRGCDRWAECLLEGWPFCLDHADDQINRWEALALARELGLVMRFPPIEGPV